MKESTFVLLAISAFFIGIGIYVVASMIPYSGICASIGGGC